MMQVYTIPETRRMEIEKAVARCQRKADKYGAPLTVEYGTPYAKEIPIYDKDGHVLYKVGSTMIEVFDLTIDSEIIRKDGYSVVASIEHLNGGNLVNTINGDTDPAWSTATCKCDHCGTSRTRSKTFIVRHKDGSEKQVGRGCLKEYCGIDPQRIGINNELNELLTNSDVNNRNFDEHTAERAYDTIKALALAMRMIRLYGYVKSDEMNSNKIRIIEALTKNEQPTAEEIANAKEMALAITNIEHEAAFDAGLDNAQTIMRSDYCKANHVGYIAYAPIAYRKYAERLEREAAREAEKDAERKASGYVGEIGKRICIEIADMKLVTSWETQWGMTWLYKFTDTDGNVLVWFASNPMTRVNENGAYEDVTSVQHIKATVKDHTERDGVKQTIITRCKAA